MIIFLSAFDVSIASLWLMIVTDRNLFPQSKCQSKIKRMDDRPATIHWHSKTLIKVYVLSLELPANLTNLLRPKIISIKIRNISPLFNAAVGCSQNSYHDEFIAHFNHSFYRSFVAGGSEKNLLALMLTSFNYLPSDQRQRVKIIFFAKNKKKKKMMVMIILKGLQEDEVK